MDLPTVTERVEIVSLINDIVQCYSQSKISAQIQETEREKVRQQARVFIAQYECDTQKTIEEIKSVTNQNIEMIRAIGAIMCRPDVNKDMIEFCKIMLENLK